VTEHVRSVETGHPDHAHAVALAALTAGQLAEARGAVAAALMQERSPVECARLLQLQARLSLWCGPVDLSAWQRLVEAAEAVHDADPELAAHILCDAAVLAAYTRQLPMAERLAARALALTGGEGAVGALAATDLGIAYGLVGRTQEAGPLLARAGDLLDAEVGIAEAAELLQHVVLALVVQERYDEAVQAAGRFLAAARPLGGVGLLPLPLCLLAHAAWKAGAWEQVRLAAAEALTLARGTQETALELYASAMLALVAGGQGRASDCLTRATTTLQLSDSTGIGMFRVTAQMSLVHLALGTGCPQDGLQPLAQVAALMQGARRAGMLNWHADHVEVLARVGREDDAHEVLAELERDASSSRWEAAVLPRCRALLESDDDVAVADLRASVEAFGWQPYEQARSRLLLAQRLPAGSAQSCEQARLAHEVFSRLRARGWAAQAVELIDGAVPVLPAAVPAAGLELRLLGDFTVLRGGAPAVVPLGTGAQALKYVALHGGRASTDQLVEALWPDAEPGKGRARLRNVLTRLRRDGEVLVRSGDSVALPPGTTVDVALFHAEADLALGPARPDTEQLARRAIDRYAGELLPGDRYQDWTSGARERLRGRHLQLLDLLAELAASKGDVDGALSWWERALEVEPYDEDRYVAMARELVAHGRPGQAHRVVRRAHAVLDRLGVSASQALRDLGTAIGV
jgi:DNA-binding SARP family transcriptional activator